MVCENIRYIGGPLHDQVRRVDSDNSYDDALHYISLMWKG
jgi:hypothetical protein